MIHYIGDDDWFQSQNQDENYGFNLKIQSLVPGCLLVQSLMGQYWYFCEPLLVHCPLSSPVQVLLIFLQTFIFYPFVNQQFSRKISPNQLCNFVFSMFRNKSRWTWRIRSNSFLWVGEHRVWKYKKKTLLHKQIS